jgi:hypothetical protein
MDTLLKSLFEEIINDCSRNYFCLLFIALSKTDVKQWCTEHGYELLELEKSTTSESDDDDDEEEDEGSHRKCV